MHTTCLSKCTNLISLYSFSMDLQDFLIRARIFKLYRQALRVAARAPPPARGKLTSFTIYLFWSFYNNVIHDNACDVQVNWGTLLDKRLKLIETAMTNKGSVSWLVKAWTNWNDSMKCLICKVTDGPTQSMCIKIPIPKLCYCFWSREGL